MLQGWECPRCHKINSPYTTQCSCTSKAMQAAEKWDGWWTDNTTSDSDFIFDPGPTCGSTAKPIEIFKYKTICKEGE